jgi:L-ascorbate metabolism protein UlaG (beta-lactamase superfamily)
MPKLIYHGHSCAHVESSQGNVAFDPFLTGNPLADCQPEDLPDLSAILLTHGHGDHLGDSISLAKKHGAPVVGTFELASYCQSQGTQAITLNIGGAVEQPWGRVKLVQAWHSSSFQVGDRVIYTGMPTGVLHTVEGKTLYHLGDTALFSDLELIGRLNAPIHVALVPIGDHFTMGIAEAVEAVKMIKPEIAVPVHYNTFPPIKQDPMDFVRAADEAGFRVQVLKPGESLDY